MKTYHLRPWTMEQREMSPHVLLMAKLFYVLLLWHGFLFDLNDPYLPFIPALDFLNGFPGLFKFMTRMVFIVSGLMLLFNIKVRINSFLLGLVIIIGILASKPIFRNHLFIIGCALLLAGLTEKNRSPVLIYWQMSLLYLAAFLSKASDFDWWSGLFMHNWLYEATENPYYLFLTELMPEFWLARVFSWGTIVLEFIIGITILIPKTRVFAVWMILIFHVFLYSFVGTKFGFFVDDIFLILIAFLTWPKKKIYVEHADNVKRNFLWFLKKLDLNGSIIWRKKKFGEGTWINVKLDDTRQSNMKAVCSLILYTPGFYILLFVLNLLIELIEMHKIRYLLFVGFAWSLIFFFARYDLLNDPFKQKEPRVI